MATVDDRVVSASFETSKFESGIQRMLSGLDRLKKSLDFQNAGKGLNQINAAANKTDLSHISRGIDDLNSKFGALRITAIATLASIATRAVSAGAQFAKQFTFQPVIDGLHEYENQLNSVQTILANTKSAGTNLTQVNDALNQLNHYADKTIYNFGQMTKNIGTFTAAGVDLKTSVASIKGISNLAALSGSSAEQASTAMYQLSQAISSGRVSLQDWNSVVNAGMGGAVFQRALAQTAQAMGKLKDGAVQLKGPMKNVSIEGQSFRESIQAKPGEKSWLTSDVLTNTLKQFSGDLTKAQLKAQGFNDAQIKAIQSQAKTALNAATQVKTLSQLLDTTKEAIGSGWAQTWQLVFGDFGEAKTLFTGLSNAIGGFINASANARNKVLKDWKALGGRKLLIEGLKNSFQALAAIVKPIKDAFRDIFPRKSGKDLFELTKRFEKFSETLKPSPKTVENLRRTFRGFFAVLDIGKQIIGGIFTVFGKLFGALGKGSGGFLNFTGSIGDFLVSVDEALKKGNKLHNFFAGIGTVISAPIALLAKFGAAIGKAFGGANITGTGKQLGFIQRVINNVTETWDKFIESVSGAPDALRPAINGISQMFGGFGEAVATALKGANFDAIFKVIEVSLLGGIFLTLKKALSGGLGDALAGGVLKSIVQAFTGVGGLTRSIGGTFNALTGSIQTMQQNVKSDTLKNIAISIALLSASMVGLSLVDPKRLNSALTAITIGFGQLLGAMAIMDKIGKSGGFIKMPVIAASMVILAAAIDLLAIAVFSLSKLSWEQLAKGLGAVSVLLIGISAAAGPLSANSAGMIRAGLGITIIAVAMNILAKAVKSFGGMDMATLAKGIGGVALALAGIGAAAQLFPSGMVALGVGLIAIGAGLELLTKSIANLGAMKVSTLAKGIGAIALALAGIGLAMQLMPGPAMVVTAAGLILVGVALGKIGKAIGTMGGMSIEQLAKGIGALAASLTILTVALYAMSGTLAGAAALAVAAAGLALLAPALKVLGQQSWTQIIKGMVALATALGVLGIAATVLTPVVPAILALGVALIAVGAGLALAGAGVALLGVGLGAIAVAGPAAVKILVDALVQLTEALPKVITGLVDALLKLVQSIAKAAPQFVQAIGKIIALMAQAIVVAAPQLGKAIEALLTMVFKVLRDKFPDLVKTGFEMLMALLKGIRDNIAQVVKMVVTIVGKFLGAIASNLGKIISGGAQILLAILKGIANNIGKVLTTATSIITKFLGGIANAAGKIVTAGGQIVVKIVEGIAKNIGKAVTAAGNVISGFIRGIGNAGSRIVTAGVNAAIKFVNAVSRGAVRMADAGATAVINFLNGVARVIRNREPELIQAGFRIGAAIVQGMINGMGSLAGKLASKAEHMITSLPGKALKVLGINSPSKVFIDIGQSIVEGLTIGISASSSATKAVSVLGGNLIDAFTEKVLHKSPELKTIGALAAGEFFTGILGVVQTSDQVETGFASMIDKVGQSITDMRAKIRDDWKKAQEAEDKGNEHALKKALNAYIDHQNALKALLDTNALLKKGLAAEKGQLQGLVKDFNDISQKLEDAKSTLESLKQARDDFATSTSDKFGALPDIVTTDANGNPIDPDKQVTNYGEAITTSTDAVTKFTDTLGKLRDLGLNDDIYKQLLDIGPAAQGFADALLKAGPAAVAALNAADAKLKAAAKTLGDNASHSLFDAGVTAAQGLVDGLESQKSAIYTKMVEIATLMVKAIKKALHMKSPSRVFAEIGEFTMEGMAQGLSNSSKVVTDAIYGVSDDAVAAIKKSMRDISDVVSSEIDPNPTITPVLDLSKVQNGSKSLASILNAVPVTATTSLDQATSISSEQKAPTDSQNTPGEQSVIKFEQNNFSPESLSSIEIYRQTKNLFSQAKSALDA